ncbi:NUDIX domain-containing protein [soil metagenome]
MPVEDAELQSSRKYTRAQVPRDSATLIIVRHDGDSPRVLMGERHGGHAFMPNKYVFPGGRLDAADCSTRVESDLHPAVLEKLVTRMRGRSSLARARGLAIAAVRETFDDTGLVIGSRPGAPADRVMSWSEILQAGLDLSGLRYFARAITPPGRTRRFDSRFFIADARHVGNLDRPLHPGSGELLETRWFTFAEALALELPNITREILNRLSPRLAEGPDLDPAAPVSFQYFKGNTWREDML